MSGRPRYVDFQRLILECVPSHAERGFLGGERFRGLRVSAFCHEQARKILEILRGALATSSPGNMTSQKTIYQEVKRQLVAQVKKSISSFQYRAALSIFGEFLRKAAIRSAAVLHVIFDDVCRVVNGWLDDIIDPTRILVHNTQTDFRPSHCNGYCRIAGGEHNQHTSRGAKECLPCQMTLPVSIANEVLAQAWRRLREELERGQAVEAYREVTGSRPKFAKPKDARRFLDELWILPKNREIDLARHEVEELAYAYYALERACKALLPPGHGRNTSKKASLADCSDIATVVELENRRLQESAPFEGAGVVYRLLSNGRPEDMIQTKARTLTRVLSGAKAVFVITHGASVLNGNIGDLHEEGCRLDNVDGEIARGMRPYGQGKFHFGEEAVDAEVRWKAVDGGPTRIGLMRKGILPVPTAAFV